MLKLSRLDIVDYYTICYIYLETSALLTLVSVVGNLISQVNVIVENTNVSKISRLDDIVDYLICYIIRKLWLF
jgi:hypothetical protein